MLFTVSMRPLLTKWKYALKIITALLCTFIIIQLLNWLGEIAKPEPKLRDQIKEKPLRVENFHDFLNGYNKS